MVRKARTKYKGATYHVYSIGNLKQYIFLDEAAIRRFVFKMIEYSKSHGVEVHAYCVMGNHYHMLITTPEPNISEFMHDLLSSYGSYMVERGWLGHVFAKRFDSIVVEEKAYLFTLVKYIHMNPVKAGIVTSPEDYPWSSWRAYIAPGGGNDHDWLETASLMRQFDSDPMVARVKLRDFVLKKPPEDFTFPGDMVIARAITGSETNVGELRRLLSGESIPTSDMQRRMQLKAQGLSEAYKTVLDHYGLEALGALDTPNAEASLNSANKRRVREARRVFIYLVKECTIATNGEIAKLLGDVGETLVSQQYGNMKKRVEAATVDGVVALQLKETIEIKRQAGRLEGLGR